MDDLNVIEIENGIYDPDNFCIYNGEGYLIKESCVLRGNNNIAYNPKTKIDISKNKSDQTVVYGGVIAGPFGHMITEGSSRLWFLIRNKNLPVIYNSKTPLPNYMIRLLTYAGILVDGFFKPKRPTQFKKILIPEATFRNGLDCNPAHLKFFHKIGRKFANPNAIDNTLYLSRRRISHRLRKIVNEEQIEKKANGKVYYPEKETIEDQIQMINSRSHVAGCVGSALHLLLFRVNPIKKITILCANEQGKYINFRMIDELKGYKSDFVECLRRDQNCNKIGTVKQNFIADLAKVKI